MWPLPSWSLPSNLAQAVSGLAARLALLPEVKPEDARATSSAKNPIVPPSTDSVDAPAAPTLSIPARPIDAETGTEFATRVGETKSVGTNDLREDAIELAIGAGNVPDSLRQLVPITSVHTINGVRHEARVYVMPDYLAVGSNDDSVRMPMYVSTAQRLADAFGARLPTKKIAALVFEQASTRLPFVKLTPDTQREAMAHMEDMRWFVDHDRAIDAQPKVGPLLAGHKKDSVISNMRGQSIDGVSQRHQVAIFLPHVQPLRTKPHFHRHSDYSQGIRFVSPVVHVKVGER